MLPAKFVILNIKFSEEEMVMWFNFQKKHGDRKAGLKKLRLNDLWNFNDGEESKLK